jgi:hypothetical protein
MATPRRVDDPQRPADQRELIRPEDDIVRQAHQQPES